MLTYITGVILICLAYIYYRQTISRFGRLINEFPGPKTVPILGNILDIQVPNDQLFKTFRKFSRTYDKTYRLWLLNYPMVCIANAEDAEILLKSNKHITKGLIYEFLFGWLGTGLLTSTDRKWQHRRKLLTPSFHFNILRRFSQVFGEHSLNLVEELKTECSKSKTDVVPFISHTTLQAICETAMGTTLDPNNKTQRGYFQAIYDIADVLLERIKSPWLYNSLIFNALPIGWKHSRLVKTLHNFTESVIVEREANFKDTDVENLDKDDEDIGIVKKKKLAMLDLLISAKKNKNSIDDNGIREEVDTFMFEGHDTTSAGICYTLLILANEKEHQEKIVEELEEIFGKSKRPATYDDLQKMQYLELCLKESQRLFPSVPGIGRTINEDLKLTHATIPAGANINLFIYDIHRNPKYFPNPEKYDPERFLPENSIGRHPFAYIPFSAGPRNCIGQKFAMLEMKSIVSAILRNYILEPVDTPESLNYKVDFVLRNEGSCNVKFKLRN